MEQTLESEDVIVCTDLYKKIKRGKIIAFYNNDKILIKRVVGLPGDSISIDNDGVLYINGERQAETYVTTLSLEPCDIEFPIEVPDDSYFVLGDRRTTSMDSRSESVGMIAGDKVIGKVLFRIWPFNKLGTID